MRRRETDMTKAGRGAKPHHSRRPLNSAIDDGEIAVTGDIGSSSLAGE
jgi:hypothetical protein